jgi:hypothetical protein
MNRLLRVGIVAAVAIGGLTSAAPAVAQAPVKEVEADPMRCWWDTDRRSVHIGEQFTLKITCAVVETAKAKAVPVANQLEPTAVQVAPFEVMAGTRREDVITPPWRYFQYEYTLRLMADKYFGQDVDIPSIKITYRMQFPANSGAEGRDLSYVLPALPVRVLSLVPKNAADIRDTAPATFGDIEARRFRSTTELVAAAALFGFGVILLGFALLRTWGQYRRRVPAAVRPLPARALLGGCLRDLGRIRSEAAQSGWTPDLAARALTIFRIAAAVAVGRRVAQVSTDKHAQAHAGQLVLPKGLLGQRRAHVSAATTVGFIDARLAGGNGNGIPVARDATIDQLRESLRLFGAARYGRNGGARADLDAAVEAGAQAIRRLRMKKLWPEWKRAEPTPTPVVTL